MHRLARRQFIANDASVTDPWGEQLEMYHDAFVASASRIAPPRGSLSLDEAEAIVIDEHSARGITLRDGAARKVADELLWPHLWRWLHPFKAHRERRLRG